MARGSFPGHSLPLCFRHDRVLFPPLHSSSRYEPRTLLRSHSQWMRAELMRRDPNRAERWCIVFYEDLVNQGTETMNELSEFLARSATGGNTMAIPVNSLPMQQRPRTNHKYSLRECVDQSTEEEYEVSDSKRHPFHSNAYEQDLVSRMRELYDQYRRMKALMTNPTAAKEEVAVSEGRIPRD